MKSNSYIPHTNYLKNVIRSIWQVNDLTPYKNEIIIPKGVVEIIFDLSESNPVQSRIYNKQYQLAKCFINGFNTYPVQVQLPQQHYFFGVQFHPGVIKHLLGVPAGEFINTLIDLTLIDQPFNFLWEQLAEAKTFNERVIVITEWLESKMIETAPRDLLLNSFLEKDNRHAISVTDFSKTVCYSPRHLSRKIYELTGMNTEQFLRYKKYLHAVHLIHDTDLALTEIAYDSSFSDQSHFIKSFKTFAHITPNEYRKSKGRIPGHILKDVR